MTKNLYIDSLPELDIADYLDTEETIAAYLNEVLAENDAGLLAAALGDIARAKGMKATAQKSGITREALYKALRGDAKPRFETVSRVCGAIGLKIEVKPAEAVSGWVDVGGSANVVDFQRYRKVQGHHTAYQDLQENVAWG